MDREKRNSKKMATANAYYVLANNIVIVFPENEVGGGVPFCFVEFNLFFHRLFRVYSFHEFLICFSAIQVWQLVSYENLIKIWRHFDFMTFPVKCAIQMSNYFFIVLNSVVNSCLYS